MLSFYMFLLVTDALTTDVQEDALLCIPFADDIVVIDENAAEVQSRSEKW